MYSPLSIQADRAIYHGIVLASCIAALLAPPPPLLGANNPSLDGERTVVQRLCEGYERISSISCDIRKTTTSEETRRTIRMLSHVFFKKPGMLNIDNAAPTQRRIVCDGKRLYYHEKDKETGFSQLVDLLKEPMRSAAKNIPATPREHLIRLTSTAEARLPGSTAYPIRVAYQTKHSYVVLSCDDQERLVLIEVFASKAMEKLTMRHVYSKFLQVNKDCWIPRKHQSSIFLAGKEILSETRRITALAVNKPIPTNLFDPDLFFENVTFSSDFMEMYK